MEKKFLKVKSGKIYYEIHKKKRMLAFLNGQCNNTTMYHKYVKHFQKKGYGTLTLDFLGEGKSSKPKGTKNYSIENYSDNLKKIFATEKIDKAVLIGFSLGGLVAQEFAANNPEKTKALVLMGTSYNIIETFVESKSPFYVYRKPIAIFLKRSLKLLELVRGDNDQYHDFSQKKFRRMPMWRFWFYLNLKCSSEQRRVWNEQGQNMGKWDSRKFLKKLKVPVLLIFAKKDSIVPSSAAWKMKELIPNCSEPVMIPKLNHNFVIRKPSLIIKEIEKFLEQT